MILVGIDDTDIVGSKGTNQLAKAIAEELSSDWNCRRIVRHQLLEDPRVPCTTKNGSASILIEPKDDQKTAEESEILVIHQIREIMKRWYIKGSDPGLCVCKFKDVDESIVHFGYRCQFELVSQTEALSLANESNIHLEGLGGTNGGIIGALAAVGLGYQGNDGRVVQIGNRTADMTGRQSIPEIESLGVEVTDLDSDESLHDGYVVFNKKLRPNLRGNRIILYVQKDRTLNEEKTYAPVKFL